ncbi:MAG: DUF983 domain-containing protein [Alphaproteobacteria bacterium]|nr:DUF983 domain-containing protein [Alphaproteobacteria bacterium]
MTLAADYYPRLSSVATGLRCACPRCGQGKLYQGLLTVRDNCDKCSLDLSRFNVDDGAAFFIIVVYSAVIIPLALWVEFSFGPPIWVHILIWIPVILGGAIALMRPFKAWLVAQHYKHNIDGESH